MRKATSAKPPTGGVDASAEREAREVRIDEALIESFPASDPPAYVGADREYELDATPMQYRVGSL
jgi:hypothetical protein